MLFVILLGNSKKYFSSIDLLMQFSLALFIIKSEIAIL